MEQTNTKVKPIIIKVFETKFRINIKQQGNKKLKQM